MTTLGATPSTTTFPATAADVPFVPAGTIAATNVQAAIEEVAAAGPKTAREWVQQGGASTVPESQVAQSWTHFGGDALLDYTDPVAPTVVEAGIYAVMVIVATGVLNVDDITKQWFVGLDAIGGDIWQDGQASFIPLPHLSGVAYQSRSLTAYLAAGDSVELIISHNLDAAVSFNFDGWLQRIS